MFSKKLKLFSRELLFRLYCKHRQGDKPNIMVYCSRRGGSTWLLNTIAAHPGMRYVGRPFMTVLDTRWASKVPSLAKAARYDGDKKMRQIIHFKGEDEAKFRSVAENIIESKWHVYPSVNFRAPYFNRVTNRVVFQMTSGLPMIRWFENNFDVDTVYLIRHPIPNALSIMDQGWEPECFEFLENQYFVDTFLTDRQMDVSTKIENGNCLLSRHVLDWCLKHLVPLREIKNATGSPPVNWTCLCYEDLVTHPTKVVPRIADSLSLPDVDSMLRQVQAPSRTVTKTTAGKVSDENYLLNRWRNKLDNQKEIELMKILDTFELDVYRSGENHPAWNCF